MKVFKYLYLQYVYRNKMGKYAEAIQNLQSKLMKIIFGTLGLNNNYLQEEINGGSQIMAVNCYPACPEPGLTLGILHILISGP